MKYKYFLPRLYISTGRVMGHKMFFFSRNKFVKNAINNFFKPENLRQFNMTDFFK